MYRLELEGSEVRAYVTEKKYTFDPEAFVAHYTANGWKVGRNAMKSWEASCTTWVMPRSWSSMASGRWSR